MIYGNSATGSDNSSSLLRLQSNGTDKFRVTNVGAGIFANSLSATFGSFSSGLLVNGVGVEATFNVPIHIGSSAQYKSGAYATFTASPASYFDFNGDSDVGAPSCGGSGN